jgi:hypothetical protein
MSLVYIIGILLVTCLLTLAGGVGGRIEASNRSVDRSISLADQCLQEREDEAHRCSMDYELINDVRGTTALLDVIRQHALAVGLENLTMQDDGMVYEGEPDGNGALYFQNCANEDRPCQEMAIQTTVYSTDPQAELFLDNPVNLDDIEF